MKYLDSSGKVIDSEDFLFHLFGGEQNKQSSQMFSYTPPAPQPTPQQSAQQGQQGQQGPTGNRQMPTFIQMVKSPEFQNALWDEKVQMYNNWRDNVYRPLLLLSGGTPKQVDYYTSLTDERFAREFPKPESGGLLDTASEFGAEVFRSGLSSVGEGLSTLAGQYLPGDGTMIEDALHTGANKVTDIGDWIYEHGTSDAQKEQDIRDARRQAAAQGIGESLGAEWENFKDEPIDYLTKGAGGMSPTLAASAVPLVGPALGRGVSALQSIGSSTQQRTQNNIEYLKAHNTEGLTDEQIEKKAHWEAIHGDGARLATAVSAGAGVLGGGVASRATGVVKGVFKGVAKEAGKEAGKEAEKVALKVAGKEVPVDKLAKMKPAGIIKRVAKAGATFVKEAGTEGASEYVEQVGGNMASLDPNQDLTEGANQAAAQGAMLGGMLAGPETTHTFNEVGRKNQAIRVAKDIKAKSNQPPENGTPPDGTPPTNPPGTPPANPPETQVANGTTAVATPTPPDDGGGSQPAEGGQQAQPTQTAVQEPTTQEPTTQEPTTQAGPEQTTSANPIEESTDKKDPKDPPGGGGVSTFGQSKPEPEPSPEVTYEEQLKTLADQGYHYYSDVGKFFNETSGFIDPSSLFKKQEIKGLNLGTDFEDAFTNRYQQIQNDILKRSGQTETDPPKVTELSPTHDENLADMKKHGLTYNAETGMFVDTTGGGLITPDEAIARYHQRSGKWADRGLDNHLNERYTQIQAVNKHNAEKSQNTDTQQPQQGQAQQPVVSVKNHRKLIPTKVDGYAKEHGIDISDMSKVSDEDKGKLRQSFKNDPDMADYTAAADRMGEDGDAFIDEIIADRGKHDYNDDTSILSLKPADGGRPLRPSQLTSARQALSKNQQGISLESDVKDQRAFVSAVHVAQELGVSPNNKSYVAHIRKQAQVKNAQEGTPTYIIQKGLEEFGKTGKLSDEARAWLDPTVPRAFFDAPIETQKAMVQAMREVGVLPTDYGPINSPTSLNPTGVTMSKATMDDFVHPSQIKDVKGIYESLSGENKIERAVAIDNINKHWDKVPGATKENKQWLLDRLKNPKGAKTTKAGKAIVAQVMGLASHHNVDTNLLANQAQAIDTEMNKLGGGGKGSKVEKTPKQTSATTKTENDTGKKVQPKLGEPGAVGTNENVESTQEPVEEPKEEITQEEPVEDSSKKLGAPGGKGSRKQGAKKTTSKQTKEKTPKKTTGKQPKETVTEEKTDEQPTQEPEKLGAPGGKGSRKTATKSTSKTKTEEKTPAKTSRKRTPKTEPEPEVKPEPVEEPKTEVENKPKDVAKSLVGRAAKAFTRVAKRMERLISGKLLTQQDIKNYWTDRTNLTNARDAYQQNGDTELANQMQTAIDELDANHKFATTLAEKRTAIDSKEVTDNSFFSQIKQSGGRKERDNKAFAQIMEDFNSLADDENITNEMKAAVKAHADELAAEWEKIPVMDERAIKSLPIPYLDTSIDETVVDKKNKNAKASDTETNKGGVEAPIAAFVRFINRWVTMHNKQYGNTPKQRKIYADNKDLILAGMLQAYNVYVNLADASPNFDNEPLARQMHSTIMSVLDTYSDEEIQNLNLKMEEEGAYDIDTEQYADDPEKQKELEEAVDKSFTGLRDRGNVPKKYEGVLKTFKFSINDAVNRIENILLGREVGTGKKGIRRVKINDPLSGNQGITVIYENGIRVTVEAVNKTEATAMAKAVSKNFKQEWHSAQFRVVQINTNQGKMYIAQVDLKPYRIWDIDNDWQVVGEPTTSIQEAVNQLNNVAFDYSIRREAEVQAHRKFASLSEDEYFAYTKKLGIDLGTTSLPDANKQIINYLTSEIEEDLKNERVDNARKKNAGGSSTGFSGRIGPDYRQGRNVSNVDIRNTFGIFALADNQKEFFNSMEQVQAEANNIYDALMDLATITNTDPQAWSMGGRLTIDINGKGVSDDSKRTRGEMNPKVTLDPKTKKPKVGIRKDITVSVWSGTYHASLAHEMFHALDAYISQEIGYYSDEKAYGRLLYTEDHTGPNMREDLRAKWDNLVEALNNTPELDARVLKEHSANLGFAEYLLQLPEKAARTFDAYTQAMGLQKGIVNPTLTDIVNPNTAMALPKGVELERITKALDAVMKELKVRKDAETGYNQFYSKSNTEVDSANSIKSVEDLKNATPYTMHESIDARLELGKEGKRGGLVLVDSDADLPSGTQLGEGEGHVQGVYVPETGITYLVKGNLTADSAQAVLLHEAMHGNPNGTIEQAALDLVLNPENASNPAERQFFTELGNTLNENGVGADPNEVAPYAVEKLVREGRQNGFSVIDGKFMDWVDRTFGKTLGNLIRSVVARFRAWRIDKGADYKPSLDDMLAYAQLSQKRLAKGIATGTTATTAQHSITGVVKRKLGERLATNKPLTTYTDRMKVASGQAFPSEYKGVMHLIQRLGDNIYKMFVDSYGALKKQFPALHQRLESGVALKNSLMSTFTEQYYKPYLKSIASAVKAIRADKSLFDYKHISAAQFSNMVGMYGTAKYIADGANIIQGKKLEEAVTGLEKDYRSELGNLGAEAVFGAGAMTDLTQEQRDALAKLVGHEIDLNQDISDVQAMVRDKISESDKLKASLLRDTYLDQRKQAASALDAFRKADNMDFEGQNAEEELRNIGYAPIGGMTTAMAKKMVAAFEKNPLFSHIKENYELMMKMQKEVNRLGKEYGVYSQTDIDARDGLDSYVPTTGDPQNSLQAELVDNHMINMEDFANKVGNIISYGVGINNNNLYKVRQGRFSLADSADKAILDRAYLVMNQIATKNFKDGAIYEGIKNISPALAEKFKAGTMTTSELNSVINTQNDQITGIDLLPGGGSYGENDVAAQALVIGSDGKQTRQTVRIRFNDPEVAKAVKGSNVSHPGIIGNMLATITRLQQRGIVQLDWAFAPKSLIRDIPESLSYIISNYDFKDEHGNPINLSFTRCIASAFGLVRRNFGFTTKEQRANNAVWQVAVHRKFLDNEDGNLLKEFLLSKDGSGVSTQASILGAMMNQHSRGLNRYDGTLKGKLAQASDALTAWSEFFELQGKFSIYKLLRSKGVSATDARNAVLDSMNFNRKGSATGSMRALYFFLNPSIQGAHNAFKSLRSDWLRWRSIKDGRFAWSAIKTSARAGKIISLYMVMATAAQSLIGAMSGGDDDDDYLDNNYLRLPLSQRMRSISIPSPFGEGEFINIPISFGINAIGWGAGQILNDYSRGRITGSDASYELGKLMSKELTGLPISDVDPRTDPAAFVARTILPPGTTGLIDVMSGKNRWGTPLNNPYMSADLPKSQQGRASTESYYHDMAKGLYEYTGVDYSPEEVKALLEGTITWPLWRIMRGFSAGDDTTKAFVNIVGAGSFYSQGAPKALTAKYYNTKAKYESLLKDLNTKVPYKGDDTETIGHIRSRALQAGYDMQTASGIALTVQTRRALRNLDDVGREHAQRNYLRRLQQQ